MLTTPKNDCYGCGACTLVCAHHALEMRVDAEGFSYPELDATRCIRCNQCNIVCPAQHLPPSTTDQPPCLATWHSEERVRQQSSSGGVFSALARLVLEQGGAVCGAAIDAGRVHHVIIDHERELSRLRGSKYVQSDLGDCYLQIQKMLRKRRLVFFTGTPCQVAGLRAYLRRDSAYLLTGDVVCHGAPSPKVWEKYLDAQLETHEPCEVSFRCKDHGWNHYQLKLETDRQIYQIDYVNDPYMKGFLADLYSRPSCAQCPFTSRARQGDISLGDFWKIAQHDPSLDDDRGTSLILLNTDRGRAYFSQIESQLQRVQEVPLDVACQHNGALVQPFAAHPRRAWFMRQLNGERFDFPRDLHFALHEGAEYAIVARAGLEDEGVLLSLYALQQSLAAFSYSSRLVLYLPHEVERAAYRDSAFASFVEQQMESCEMIGTPAQLRGLNARFENFLLGPGWCCDGVAEAEGVAYLDFVEPEKKLCAVAPDFGQAFSRTPQRCKVLLGRFDLVAAAAPEEVQQLSAQLDVPAELVHHLVLLHDEDWWSTLASKAPPSSPQQVIARHMQVAPTLDSVRLEAVTQLRMLDLSAASSLHSWVRSIRDCAAIVTDSHAALCLALLFRKPFLVCPREPQEETVIRTLLAPLGLENRLITADALSDHLSLLLQPLDESALSVQLARMREENRQLIKVMLELPCRRNRINYATLINEANAHNRRQLDKQWLELQIILYKILTRLSWGRRRVEARQQLIKLCRQRQS